jgi:two-component system chemotaxis response regulator CheY
MKKQILVIDDDAAIRFTLEHLLSGVDVQVTCAADGDEGIRLFRSLQPDLVITDLIMPEREGIETIIEMKHERPQAKIIAISGGGRIGNKDLLQMARWLGADHIIAKPFEFDELTEMVRHSLAA